MSDEVESEVDKRGGERKTEEERARKVLKRQEIKEKTAECAKESECVNLPPVVAYNATLNRAPALISTQLPIMVR